MKIRIQNIGTVFFIGLLCTAVLVLRYHVARTTRYVSFDESVYFSMAQQVAQDWRNYTSRPYAEAFLKKFPSQESLPEYLFHPLYKHPPLFTFFNALALKLSLPLEFVPIGFSVLTVIVTYLLGALIFDKRIAIICALLLAADPINALTSQRLWPDTTMVFFMVSGVYFFIYALIKQKTLFYYLSAGLIGLASLTKYPGLLPLGGIWIYAVIYDRPMLKTKIPLKITFITLFVFSTWLVWLWVVYGTSFIYQNFKINGLIFSSRTIPILALCLIVNIYLIFYPYFKNKLEHAYLNHIRLSLLIRVFLLCGLIFCLKDYIVAIFSIYHVPNFFWKAPENYNPGRCFYFYQLSQYSPVFLFGLIALFWQNKREHKLLSFIKIHIIIIILFFMVWGSQQSRYILPAIPFLILLGVDLGRRIFPFFSHTNCLVIKKLGYFLLIIMIAVIIIKAIYINLTMSLTNAMFYY